MPNVSDPLKENCHRVLTYSVSGTVDVEGGTLAPVEGPCSALAHGDDTLDGRWHDREINGGTVEGMVEVEETKDVQDGLKGAVRE